MNYKEEVLSGGAMNRVVKIGNTVHRRVKGHPMLHSYLKYLEEAGMTGVPRFLGIDDKGREILTYLPGRTMGPDYPAHHPCFHSDEALTDMAKFMRKLHDLSAGFVPRAIDNGWENPYFPNEPYETICHGDAAIWNFVFVEGRLAGLFDFDQAYPGTRAWDLTSTVFSAVGLVYSVYVPKLNACVDYVPLKHAAERKRQIKLLFDAYGMECPPGFINLVGRQIEIWCEEMIAGAEAGDEVCVKQIISGVLRHYQKVVAHIREYGYEWI